MRFLQLIVVSAALLASNSVPADDARILEKSLKQNLSKHEVSLRVPYANKELEFGNDGVCKKDCTRGSWVRDATMLITHVELTDKELTVRADKLIIFYDLDGTRTGIRTPIVVKIRVFLPSQPTEASMGDLLSKIFFTSGDTIPNSAPADLREWRKRSHAGSTVSSGKLQPVGETADHRDVFNAGKDIKEPRVVSATQYLENGWLGRGTVTATAIIDEFGFPQVLQIEKTDSRALIQPAISALSQWTFKPATYNDSPVSCLMILGVRFGY